MEDNHFNETILFSGSHSYKWKPFFLVEAWRYKIIFLVLFFLLKCEKLNSIIIRWKLKIKTVKVLTTYNKGYQTFMKVDNLNKVWKVAQTTGKGKR